MLQDSVRVQTCVTASDGMYYNCYLMLRLYEGIAGVLVQLGSQERVHYTNIVSSIQYGVRK